MPSTLIKQAVSGMNHSELNDFAENLAKSILSESEDDQIFDWRTGPNDP
jgi:hypothetical protein